jgi:hypothetical protein
MSRSQRILVVVAAVAAVVVAYVIVKPGGGGKSSNGAAPSTARIRIAKQAVVGGAKKIKLKQGTHATIVVAVDASNKLHLHGYDIEKRATPSRPARFSFKASSAGVFVLESHTAEDAGRPPLVAKVLVEP